MNAPALMVFLGLVGAAWARRPLPVVRRPGPDVPAPSPVAVIGAMARRATGLPGEADADAAAGWAVILVIPAALVWPGLVAVVVVAALIEPRRRRIAAQRRSRRAVVQELPEAIDLLRLAVGATGSVPLALRAAAPGLGGPIGAALGAAVRHVDAGARVADAVQCAMAPLGPPARPLIRALAGDDGVGVEPTLDRLGLEARREWRRAIEAEVRRVPVRLLIPLVACILPAFMTLTVVPVLARTLFQLDLG